MAQVVERYFREVEAASSSLVTPTLKAQYLLGFLLVRPAVAPFLCSGAGGIGGMILERRWIFGHKKKQIAGIEPVSPAWEASVLPMNYICMWLFYHI